MTDDAETLKAVHPDPIPCETQQDPDGVTHWKVDAWFIEVWAPSGPNGWALAHSGGLDGTYYLTPRHDDPKTLRYRHQCLAEEAIAILRPRSKPLQEFLFMARDRAFFTKTNQEV